MKTKSELGATLSFLKFWLLNRLGHFICAETPQSAKSLERDLARIQTFVLDVLAPLLVKCGDSKTNHELRVASRHANWQCKMPDFHA